MTGVAGAGRRRVPAPSGRPPVGPRATCATGPTPPGSLQRMDEPRTSDAEATIAAAARAWRRGDTSVAEREARRAVAAAPQRPEGWRLLARLADERGDHAAASAWFDEGLAATRRSVALLVQRAAFEAARGADERAHALWDEVLDREPAHAAAVAAKAEAFERAGRPDDAIATVRRVLPAGDPGPQPPLSATAVMVRVLASRGQGDDAVALGETVLERVPLGAGGDPTGRRNLLFALARLYERAGDVDAALARATAANAILRPRFDPAAYERLVERTIAVVDATALDRLRGDAVAPTDQAVPLFVVGLPRCGSTLVERVLDAHPLVRGLGEIPDFHRLAGGLGRWPDEALRASAHDAAALGRAYREGIARRAGASASAAAAGAAQDGGVPSEDVATGADPPRLVNKDLGVLWRLGLVDACLPDARVVIVRRDPMDHGLAMFLERLRPASAPWASDLAHCGRVLRAADRLVEHWRRTLRIPVAEVRYEELVGRPRATTERLLEVLGLPWDDACLQPESRRRRDRTLSYEQASAPVTTSSVGRAAAYGDRLAALARGLRPGGG